MPGPSALGYFANRGGDELSPVRNRRGDLWVAMLLDDDREPDHFDDWERTWDAPEILRPVGDLDPHRDR